MEQPPNDDKRQLESDDEESVAAVARLLCPTTPHQNTGTATTANHDDDDDIIITDTTTTPTPNNDVSIIPDEDIIDKKYPKRFGTKQQRLAGHRKKHQEEWLKMYEELKTYQATHNGSTHFPKSNGVKNYEYKTLATWSMEQRQQYRYYCELHNLNSGDETTPLSRERQEWLRKKISHCFDQERIDLLNAIQFDWRDQTEAYWWEMYQQLVDFQKKHGHTLVSPHYVSPEVASCPKFQRLATWCAGSRQQMEEYRRLLATKGGRTILAKKQDIVPPRALRHAKLQEINMVWDLHQYEWDSKYALLVKFQQENYPRKYPHDRELFEGKRLSRWCEKQRFDYANLKAGRSSSLTRERMMKLIKIDFDFKTGVGSGQPKAAASTSTSSTTTTSSNNNNMRVDKSTQTETEFEETEVSTLKVNKKNPSAPTKKSTLKKTPTKVIIPTKKSPITTRKRGRPPSSSQNTTTTTTEEEEDNDTTSEQQQQSPAKKKKKKNAGKRKQPFVQWEERFLQLVQFEQKHGHVNPVIDTTSKESDDLGNSLARWLHNQRYKFKNGKLQEEKREKLFLLGCIGFGGGDSSSSAATTTTTNTNTKAKASSSSSSPNRLKKKNYLGMKILKKFDDGNYYVGRVVNNTPREVRDDLKGKLVNVWLVQYDDGDKEDMTEEELWQYNTINSKSK